MSSGALIILVASMGSGVLILLASVGSDVLGNLFPVVGHVVLLILAVGRGRSVDRSKGRRGCGSKFGSKRVPDSTLLITAMMSLSLDMLPVLRAPSSERKGTKSSDMVMA